MKEGRRKLLGLLLCAVMIAGLLPGTMSLARAEGKTITGLGTGAISNPTEGAGGWSKVYFGSKDSPILFNVLTTSTGNFGGTTMLLDCASILQYMKFDNDAYPNAGAQKADEWAYSDIRSWLNGTFLTDRFTTVEASAIAESTKAGKGPGDGDGWLDDWSDYIGDTPLNKDRVFLLDAVEATNTAYGFENECTSSNTRIKELNNSNGWWWLRSSGFGEGDTNAGLVNYSGGLNLINVDCYFIGVSPALNVNLKSVLFSSEISSESGSYKLTVLDDKMTVTLGSAGVSRSGNVITVPYTVGGDHAGNASQVSVVITNGKWVTDTGDLDSSVTLIGYGKLSSSNTYTLPSGYSDSCHVYIVAEDVNGEKETDYASEPLEITIPVLHSHSWTYSASGATITATCNGAGTCDITSGKTITISAPAAPLTYNGQPKAATLSSGYNTTAFPGTYTIRYQGTGSTTYDSTTAPSAAGTYQASVTVDTATASVKYEITRATQTAPAAPTAESVTENSVTLKKTDGYQYSLDGTGWQDSPIFTGLNPDTEYTFYQRIAGDENHEPSPASPGTGIMTGNITYTVSESQGTEHTAGSGEDAVYTVKRNVNDADTFKNYSGAAVDGKAVPAGGSTAEAGSLVLTLKSSYLDTLSAGDHKVTISFTDGTAESSLKIKAAAPTPSSTPAPTPSPAPLSVPKTGDNGNPVLWYGLILLGIAGLAVLGVKKASRKRK